MARAVIRTPAMAGKSTMNWRLFSASSFPGKKGSKRSLYDFIAALILARTAGRCRAISAARVERTHPPPGSSRCFHTQIVLDDRAQLLPLRSPCCRRYHPVRRLLKASSDRTPIEVFLAFEMPVETTVRQPCVFHQPSKALPLRAMLAERPRGCVDNPLVCFRFLLDGISHSLKITSIVL